MFLTIIYCHKIMTKALVVTLVATIIITVAANGRYWDEYGAGNNGVHSNPVFKGKAPVVRWTTGNNTDAFGFIGVVPLDNEEKAVYISNGDGSNPPSIWKYSWDGQLLWTWTDPNPNFIDGTLSVRNGVVYSFNDALSYLTAVEYATNKTVFNNVSIPALGYVGNPVIWNEDNTILYVSSDAVMSAINASTGSIIWETVVSPFGVSSPMARSSIDKSLIVVSNTSIVTKYSMDDGKQVWSYEASSATLGAPSAVSVDSQGNIYGVSFEGVLYKLSSAGAKLWENLDLSPLPFRNSPVLINSDYFFVGDNQVGSIYVVSTNDGKYSVAFDNTKSGPTQNMPINSHMFWNDNILYTIHADVLAAYDTSDVTTLTQLWNVSTGIGYAYQGGLSIGNDGTMFLASAAYDSTYTLMVSIGCPIGQHLAQDGTQCGYCNAGYSYNKDSAKCEKCPAEQFSDDADDTCTPCSIDPNNAQCVKTPVKNSSGTRIIVNYLLYIIITMCIRALVK